MKVEKMLPEVYFKESRDFSYISRILEVMLNHMKTNADLVNSSLNTIDSDDLLNSLAYTLGFRPKHKYINKDLLNICTNFSYIMKNKGTYYSIEQCVKILLNSQHITGSYSIMMDYDNYVVQIGLPSETKDIVLLEDLFDYILPTGWIYSIINLTEITTYEDIYYFNENINGIDNPMKLTPKYQDISQVTRPVNAGDLVENVTDLTPDESQTNVNEHSRLWSGVVHKPL